MAGRRKRHRHHKKGFKLFGLGPVPLLAIAGGAYWLYSKSKQPTAATAAAAAAAQQQQGVLPAVQQAAAAAPQLIQQVQAAL